MTDKSNIITTQEGKKKLKKLEDAAGKNLHTSREAFNDAMLALDEIRKENLWVYAVDEDGVMLMDYKKPRFKEDYLYLFCRRHGIGKSSTYKWLGIVDILHHLGITDEEIKKIGVREADPVQNLISIDGRSGEVKIAKPEVIEKLPPGDTPEERIAAKVREVYIDPPEPLSPADAFKAIVSDTGSGPSIAVWEVGDGDVWLSYEIDGDLWDGVLIPKGNYRSMSEAAREWLNKKLKIQEYGTGG